MDLEFVLNAPKLYCSERKRTVDMERGEKRCKKFHACSKDTQCPLRLVWLLKDTVREGKVALFKR